jgi:hypothetical protein
MTKPFASLALVALLLSACSAHTDTDAASNAAVDNSAATTTASDSSAPAASPADSSDPLAQYTPTFQKMEAGIDNNFADVTTDQKSGAETTTSIGFFPQYPCTVGTNADKSTYWGYCIMGVSAAQSNADANYQAATQIAAAADPSLKPGTAPADSKNIASSELENGTHAVYIFETKQPNGKYLVKMTFAKPAAMK